MNERGFSGMQTRRRSLARLCLPLSGGAACLLIVASSALANAPITSYSALPGNFQAGGHPDLEVQFSVKNRLIQRSQSPCNCEDAKNAIIHLPTGFIGNPRGVTQCSIADFAGDECPVDAQVGAVEVFAGGFSVVSPVYNVEPPPEVAGLLAFKPLADAPQYTVLSSRTGSDYGLDATATSIFHGLGLPLESFREDLWGVPANPVHNQLRFPSGTTEIGSGEFCDATGSKSNFDPNSIVKLCLGNTQPVASNSPETPFLQNPTTCDTPLSSSIDVLSYDGGSDHRDLAWPQMTGCDQLGFNPSLYAQPTTTDTDSASGIDVDLTIPQELSPTIPSPTELKGATVTLPVGFSINPNAADGKISCSDTDAHFGTEEEAQCPEYSKVGSLTIDSSALPGPLPGFVYLGEPMAGNRYRIFLVANGFAVHIKLAGLVRADPSTGQLVIGFENLPQSPLTAFKMHFFGSERGLLATPTQCGTYPVTSTFTPWDSSLASQSSTQYFTLEHGPYGAQCPASVRPFSPGFKAASASHSAGAHGAFSLEVSRNDGDQTLAELTVNTPPGFSATLAGVPYCSDAALAQAAEPSYSGLAEQESPSCPEASQIGTAVAGAGAGNHPLYVSGKVYLAGPYKGAPLSLAVITPAVSGPYDLGNVVVRAALHVDPSDAHITAISDPLPQILQGIPLRLRVVRISLDRPHFALNPTNCSPFSVSASVTGDQSAIANLSEHFQVANCGTLPFEPKLALSLSGGTKRAQNPALHAVLTAKPGEANIAAAQVTLPHSELLDNAHIGTACTKPVFAEGRALGEKCPADSIYGFARAETPLLDKPLEGSVYLRSPLPGHKLPDLVAALNGQIDVALVGKVDTGQGGGIRNTFELVPDAPVSKFTLNLDGGRKGLLESSQDICEGTLHAVVTLTGQNGKRADTYPVLQTPCSAKSKRHFGRTRLAR